MFGAGVANFMRRGLPDKKELFELDDSLLKLVEFPIVIDRP
jgi:hypothetical protein